MRSQYVLGGLGVCGGHIRWIWCFFEGVNLLMKEVESEYSVVVNEDDDNIFLFLFYPRNLQNWVSNRWNVAFVVVVVVVDFTTLPLKFRVRNSWDIDDIEFVWVVVIGGGFRVKPNIWVELRLSWGCDNRVQLECILSYIAQFGILIKNVA